MWSSIRSPDTRRPYGQAAPARRTADKFHTIKLAGQAVTEVRCPRQQEFTGHRGRSHDPLYRTCPAGETGIRLRMQFVPW